MVTFLSMTVDVYKNKCVTFRLLYAFQQTPFGRCLIAITDTGEDVAYLGFVDRDDVSISDLKAKWPLTRILEDTENKTGTVIMKIFRPDDQHSVRVLVKGTEFQIKVWEALTRIPRGTVVTYEDVARMVNSRAPIAVGSAISKNYVAYIVPCHRVIAKERYRARNMKYAWGMERKVDILRYEGHTLSSFVL